MGMYYVLYSPCYQAINFLPCRMAINRHKAQRLPLIPKLINQLVMFYLFCNDVYSHWIEELCYEAS